MKALQKKIDQFCEENNMCRSATYRVLDMVSEVGEVAKEILEMSDYGKKRITYRASLKMELGDLLYSLITVANAFNFFLWRERQ